MSRNILIAGGVVGCAALVYYGTPAFQRQGAVGKQFKEDGAIGGTADKVGGPFKADGAVGSKFTGKDGGPGGAAQAVGEAGEEVQKKTERKLNK